MIVTVTARREGEVTVKVKLPDGTSVADINTAVNAALFKADYRDKVRIVGSHTATDDGHLISYFGEI